MGVMRPHYVVDNNLIATEASCSPFKSSDEFSEWRRNPRL